MADPVIIGGVSVDPADPCATWQALYAVRLQFVAGQRTEEIEVRSPVSNRRVKFGAANIAALDQELARLAKACDEKNGKPRTRFAKSVRFRPTY
ncbi:MAG: hypothetical protein R3184_13970 [Aurantimonas coralicida]|uniref:hypothetical protein n=1 Tax=Aurantimonas coralicida TaxID=182270 RepID=UPI001D189BAF|nr:hypothetical protein [Aurantimonas coralicida]MCC4296305.1 hypothetical protein [Aurantimonas coralicida]MDX1732241.1 hypothetical protein [Aurantimonas coralicida]